MVTQAGNYILVQCTYWFTQLASHNTMWSVKITACVESHMSGSLLGLVDFAIGLVSFVLNLPNGQVLFFGVIQITEGL